MIKLSNLIVTSILSTFIAFPFTAKAEEHPLVGISYPPLPEEVSERRGWTIDETYSVNYVFMKGQELLLLDRLTRRSSSGQASFQVIDVLTLPAMVETEEITGGSSCFVNGKEASNLIVIAKPSDTAFFTKARKAWRVENEKFNEIEVTGLRFQCENFNYGF